MIAEQALRTGDLAAAVGSALFGEGFAEEVLNASRPGPLLLVNAGLAALNFTNALAPLALLGAWHLRRRLGPGLAAALSAIAAIHVAFVARYPVPDQFTFLLPTLVLIGAAASVGLAVLAEAGPGVRRAAAVACALSLVASPVVYAAAPAALEELGVQLARGRATPFRDEARYWLVPWKHDERSAQEFAEAALRETAPDGVLLFERRTLSWPVLYLQRARGNAPGVLVASATDPRPPGRPLFSVAPGPGIPLTRITATP
jgi:hypothetical protein